MAIANISFALFAGLFSILSPCVLPLVPVVLGTAVAEHKLAPVGGPLSNWAEQRFGETPRSGLRGQFGLGVLLGAVWSPCVGPTLGAASVLAAQGRDLGQVALTMFAFGIGSALPLLLLGMLSRE